MNAVKEIEDRIKKNSMVTLERVRLCLDKKTWESFCEKYAALPYKSKAFTPSPKDLEATKQYVAKKISFSGYKSVVGIKDNSKARVYFAKCFEVLK